ncbi:peptide IlvX [Leclercia adecarboxylata]
MRSSIKFCFSRFTTGK